MVPSPQEKVKPKWQTQKGDTGPSYYTGLPCCSPPRKVVGPWARKVTRVRAVPWSDLEETLTRTCEQRKDFFRTLSRDPDSELGRVNGLPRLGLFHSRSARQLGPTRWAPAVLIALDPLMALTLLTISFFARFSPLFPTALSFPVFPPGSFLLVLFRCLFSDCSEVLVVPRLRPQPRSCLPR